jgi:hypothetical protein
MTAFTVTSNNAAEQFESFTEADQESVGLEATELENLEGLESTLEDIKPESVAESLEGYMEGDTERLTPSAYVNKRLLQVFTALVKTSIKKITTNPKTRVKLQAACRKGPDAVTQLLLPTLIKTIPSYFNWIPAVLVPPIVTRLFPAICKQVGLKPGDISIQPVGPTTRSR